MQVCLLVQLCIRIDRANTNSSMSVALVARRSEEVTLAMELSKILPLTQ